MAGRPKKSETAEKTTKSTKAVDNTQEQLKILQEQIAKLMAENETLKAEKEKEKEKKISVATVKEEVEEELTSDTDITVISQTVGKLVISTEGNGVGTVYRFEEFGEVQDIPFGDLKDIVKNKPRFAKEGAYFICNPQAVKKLRLGNQYKNLIDDKTFVNLFDKDAKTIIALYESAPKMQQEQVVSLIQDRLDNGLEVDGNVLIKIGQLCGRDFITKE
jgi:regulator of replication initiation timing